MDKASTAKLDAWLTLAGWMWLLYFAGVAAAACALLPA
jgi:hypothetical protein